MRSLCREVADSSLAACLPDLASVPGCRIRPRDEVTTRCGHDAVAGAHEALLDQAAAAKLLRTPGSGRYHRGGGCGGLSDRFGSAGKRRSARQPRTGERTKTPARNLHPGAGSEGSGDEGPSIAAKVGLRGEQNRDQARPRLRRSPVKTGTGSPKTAMREAAAVIRQRQRACVLQRAAKGRLHRADQRPAHPDGTPERVVAQNVARRGDAR